MVTMLPVQRATGRLTRGSKVRAFAHAIGLAALGARVGPLVAAWVALSGAALALSPSAHAADGGYPERPVRIVIPGGAGSGPDVLMRYLADRLEGRWKTPVVVENVVGAGGNIGHQRVARATADGYTLLTGMIGPMAINPALQSNLGYDPVRDFVPIALVSRYPNLLVVNPKLPIESIQDLLKTAREQPERIRYGTPGKGTTPHLSAVLLGHMTGVRMTEVPYKSSAQMVADLVAGHIDIAFLNPPALLPLIKDGRLRALGITSRERASYAPQIPTLHESGLTGYELNSWYGLFAPKGTPPAVVASINASLRQLAEQPEVRKQFEDRGDDLAIGSADEAAAFLVDEVRRWAALVSDAKITAE